MRDYVYGVLGNYEDEMIRYGDRVDEKFLNIDNNEECYIDLTIKNKYDKRKRMRVTIFPPVYKNKELAGRIVIKSKKRFDDEILNMFLTDGFEIKN